MQFAEILIPQKIFQDKEALTYSIPEELEQIIKIGQNVKVPLKNRKINAVVWAIHKEKPSFKTFPVVEIVDMAPVLSEQQITLINWISSYYFCPIRKIIKLFIPKRVLSAKPIKTRKKKENEEDSKEKSDKPKTLTPLQKNTVDEILKSNKKTFLIHGITGSGKTEIYTNLAKHYIDQKKQVLILVPEISLTPQIIKYFEKSLGISAAIIHSKLSEGEKVNFWNDIHENKSKLIIGSRSAIFAPFKTLELIIIDEEHELSYKQDNSPRYTTFKVAEKIQELNPTIKIVLGSATPSIETAETLKNSTIKLNERIGDHPLPEIEIVDLRDEFKKQNRSIFSERLQEEMEKTLKTKGQAILFLNRRGSNSSVVCRDCGYTALCENCQTKLTYHAKTLSKPCLICHHCGKIYPIPTKCPVCKGVNIKFLGIGTERIEHETSKEFPDSKILRADKDTTSKKDSFKKIYNDFLNHKADILIGTQMIAKGLHLPEVNLVGVILADIGLNIPDFRTAERNFQLMTQVAGRAGRGKSKGKVLIQTYDPTNLALTYTQTNDYENFFKYEITQRKLLNNPPFSQLAKLLILDKSQTNCKLRAEKIENLIWKIAKENNLTEHLEINIYPAYLPRLNGNYRHILLIKDKSKNSLIHKILEKLPKEYIIDINIKIDIDPISVT